MLYYPNTDKLANKRSKFIAKCCHANTYLHGNYNSNNQKCQKETLTAQQRRS